MAAPLFVVIVVVAGLVNFESAVRAETPTDAPPSGYRDVQFGSTFYRIPYVKYHVGIQPYDPRRDHAALFFSLILPDLAPSTSDPAEVATWGNGTGWHKELHILVEYGRDFITQKQQMLNAFAQSEGMKKTTEDEARRAGRPVKHIFKYMTADHSDLLDNGCRLYHGYAIAGDTMMVCGTGASMLVVTCITNIPIHVPFPYCHVMINYAEKTQLTYSYGYSYLEQAPKIHRKLIALLDSFRLKSKN